jgi:hypothetical protein
MSIFGDIASWVGGAVSDGWNAVEGAVEGAAKAIGDFVQDAGGLLNVLRRIADFLGDSYVGFLLGGLAGETLLQIADVLGLSTVEQLYSVLRNIRGWPRRLKSQESMLIDGAFTSPGVLFGVPVKQTVPTGKIWVTPLLGFGHPFTVPASFLTAPVGAVLLGDLYGPLVASAVVAGLLYSDCYFINLGPTFYEGDALGYSPDFNFDDHWGAVGHTLIHEATHVWQGEHWDRSDGYWDPLLWALPTKWASTYNAIVRSIYDYSYDQYKQWDGYLSEQQARMVEHWFSGIGPPNPALPGKASLAPKSVANPLFRFVKRNVWTGNDHDFSNELDVSNLDMDVNAYLSYLVGAGKAAAGLTAADAGGTSQGAGGGGYSNPYTWGLGGMRPRIRINKRM